MPPLRHSHPTAEGKAEIKCCTTTGAEVFREHRLRNTKPSNAKSSGYSSRCLNADNLTRPCCERTVV